MDELEMDVLYLHNLIWKTLEVYHKQMAISGCFGFQREKNQTALIDSAFHENPRKLPRVEFPIPSFKLIQP